MEKTDENSKDNRNFNHSNFSCELVQESDDSYVKINHPKYFIVDTNKCGIQGIRIYNIVEAKDWDEVDNIVAYYGGNLTDIDELEGAVNPLSAYGVVLGAYNYPKDALLVFNKVESPTIEDMVDAIWK